MSFASGITSYLDAQTAITSLVGTRIYPLVRPQGGALPAIVWHRQNEEREHEMGAQANHLQATGVVSATVTFESYAATYLAADAIDQALRSVLHGWRDHDGTNIEVLGSFLDNTSDFLEQPIDANSPGNYMIVSTYRIVYRETIPSL